MSDPTQQKLDTILSRLDRIEAKVDQLSADLTSHRRATTDSFAIVTDTLEALGKQDGDDGAPHYATG